MTEVFNILSQCPQIFRGAKDFSGYALLNLRQSRATETLSAIQTAGAMATLVTWITSCGPAELSPIFIIYALGGKEAVYDLDFIEQLLPEHVALIRRWPQERGFADVRLGSVLASLAVEHIDISVSGPLL